MESGHLAPTTKNESEGFQLCRLTTSNDTELLCPIRYIYNYLPLGIKWLRPQPISLSHLFVESKEYKLASIHHQAEARNSICLHTKAAKLPLHTGLENFRQSKHWRASEKATKELLELFARDRRCNEVILSAKRSMAGLAEEQLKSAVIDTYSRFSVYMFAEADESRSQLLAQSVIMIFVYDVYSKSTRKERKQAEPAPDLWESASPETIETFRKYFVSRLRGGIPTATTDTPLERRLDAIRQGLVAGDEEEGNGGAEVLQTLINFCERADPPCKEFSSVHDYLDYRWEDIANSFTWACSKFSIRSQVDQGNPNLHRLLRHLGDQISIVNDIASYEKEKRRFENGRATSMINLVHVIMKVDRVEARVAKSIAYARQLCTENEILRELEELKRCDELTVEEWTFIGACLLAASGNLLTAVVISRYGGEDARVT